VKDERLPGREQDDTLGADRLTAVTAVEQHVTDTKLLVLLEHSLDARAAYPGASPGPATTGSRGSSRPRRTQLGDPRAERTGRRV
jgi:hypothetical protein